LFAKDGKKIILAALITALLLVLAVCIYPGWLVRSLSCLSILWFSFTLWFFRDPERDIPGDENTVVSPADGQVVLIDENHSDDELGSCKLVSIFMSVFNVHVNRSPLSGSVVGVKHKDGKFINAMNPRAAFENENVRILIDTGKFKFRVVQIAGLIARRIVPYVNPGDKIVRGQRIGMIKFGSKVDVYLPVNTELQIKKGDSLHAGKSVIGVIHD